MCLISAPCDSNITGQLIDVTKDIACVIHDACLSVKCCVEVPLVQRNFEVSFQADMCENTVIYSFENYTSSSVLARTEMESWISLQLQGVLQLQ